MAVFWHADNEACQFDFRVCSQYTAIVSAFSPVASLDLHAAANAEPIKECKQAESAHGTAVSGSEKCTAASAAPTVLHANLQQHQNMSAV